MRGGSQIFMTKAESYRAELAALQDWDAYLLERSGLPGPRGNLELAYVAAEMGSEAQFQHWRSFDAKRAPTNTRGEYLALCGTMGLGTLIARDRSAARNRKRLKTLRKGASDSRWRVREGVAIALQTWGDHDFGAVLDEVETWRAGNLYDQRAIAAGLCEPRLLKDRTQVKRVLKLLDGITRDFSRSKLHQSDEFVALKKGLSYCWSVAVAASPADGKRAMEKWVSSTNPDVRTVMRENLKKDRLVRMDREWVEQQRTRLG